MSGNMDFEKIRQEYLASLKSSDTEEHIDLCFYRPLGFAWACLFRKLGVTPNVVTILSIFLGVGAGLCFYPTDIWINIAGILLLIWANTYDSADGQLARMTRQYSPLGRVLDGVAGDLWFISIYLCICLRTRETVGFFADHGWMLWTLASLAGASHICQAAVADYFRQIHLFLLHGGENKELESALILRERYERCEGSPVRRLLAWLYWRYTAVQERLSGDMRFVIADLKAHPRANKTIYERLRRLSLPLCKWENFLTFNWRAITLSLCVVAGIPWVYFAIEVTVFNGVLVYLIARERRIAKLIKLQ